MWCLYEVITFICMYKMTPENGSNNPTEGVKFLYYLLNWWAFRPLDKAPIFPKLQSCDRCCLSGPCNVFTHCGSHHSSLLWNSQHKFRQQPYTPQLGFVLHYSTSLPLPWLLNLREKERRLWELLPQPACPNELGSLSDVSRCLFPLHGPWMSQ